MASASDAHDASVGGSDLEEEQEVKETGSGIDGKDGVVEADGSDVAADEVEAEAAADAENETKEDAEEETKSDAEVETKEEAEEEETKAEEAEEAKDVGQSSAKISATEDNADEEDTEQPVEVEGRGAHTNDPTPAGEQGGGKREAPNAGAVDEGDGVTASSVSVTGQTDAALEEGRSRKRFRVEGKSHPDAQHKKVCQSPKPVATPSRKRTDQTQTTQVAKATPSKLTQARRVASRSRSPRLGDDVDSASLRRQIEDAVHNEDYTRAAELKLKLKKVGAMAADASRCGSATEVNTSVRAGPGNLQKASAADVFSQPSASALSRSASRVDVDGFIANMVCETEAAVDRREFQIAAQLTSTRESVLSRVDCGLVGKLAEALQD